MTRRTGFSATLAAAAATILLCSPATSLAEAENVELKSVEWTTYGADKANTKYSALDQIHPGNLKDLKVAWRWSSPDNEIAALYPDLLRWPFESTPLMVGGVVYTSTGYGMVVALEADSGKALWRFDPQSYLGGKPVHQIFIHRGVSYWADGASGRIVYGTPDARLIALDARTGKPIPSFGTDGEVDLTKGLRRPVRRDQYGVSSPPVIVGHVVVVGSSVQDAGPSRHMPPGDVRGFDVRTGKQLWTFQTIPQQGEPGNETWENDSWRYTGNTNVWTVMSADEELGYVYLPTSTPTNDWYGGARHGDNLFAESLVCLDAKTGKRVWHFQMVHHGLWDYDLPAAPNLVDLQVAGERIPAVAQVSKQGFVYVFDRRTGKPIWPIEERPVPASDVPGEKAAATQPFPTRPPPFERQGISRDDLIDFTPELRAEAEQILEKYGHGPLFQPPQRKDWLYLPGPLGGANWTGAGFDPETGLLYVPSITKPAKVDLVEPAPQTSDLPLIHEVDWVLGPRGLPLLKPPYGRVTAVDLNRGENVWVAPLGDGPRDHPALRELELPRLGWPLRGGPLVTKTLLIVGQEARHWDHFLNLLDGSKLEVTDQKELGRFHPKLYAYDKKTGELIWERDVPANVTGVPMTYMTRNKQYIVFPVGGIDAPAELIALSLP